LIDYVQALVLHTRDSSHFEMGLSPRAGLALLRAAQAWAMLAGRKLVLPEDVQAVAPAVVGHRLRAISNIGGAAKSIDPAQDLLQSVPIP
jgi:MoxR-like ATPase